MLQGIRLSDEISQIELARSIIEKGRRLPTFEQAQAMAKFLGYSVEGFISLLIQDQLRNANIKMKVILEKAS